ncbi:hypothetical protein EX30DRAFT_309612, partial [Ascodesmis nigricans]
MATQTTYSYSPSARLFLLISGFTSIVRAEDKGDVVTDNLLTDFAPILALFGEKVTTQWLSGTFGWHDCLIFAVCPLGIITAVVSVIRVAAPNSWKAIVGRARESRALAELDLLSSTSDEVCELWSGQALVRVMGSPSVFEVAYIDDLKNQTTLGLHTIQEAKQILRNQKPGRTPTSAPNISLNLGPSPKERRRVLFVSMVFGIIVQVGVLIYGALISYYKWKTNFLKDGATPPRFAYPILAAGTILLVFGMFLCAYVIEHHTAEDKWIVDPKTIWLIWLQRGQTVNDQRFESYAICPPRPKDVLLTSRRIEKVGSVEPVHLQSKTIESDPASPFRTHAISGACITLVGFVLQFTGFRLMHWSATIAQFVATAIVTGLRVWLRRDLAERPAAQLIAKKFELDWFALNLAIRGKELWPSGIP